MGWRLESDGVNEILRVHIQTSIVINQSCKFVIVIGMILGARLSHTTVIFWNQDSLIGYHLMVVASLNFPDSNFPSNEDIRLFGMNVMG